MKILPRLALAAVALCAIVAPAAQADSVAYIKDGDVHLATPDGSRTFQVTSTGGYSDVSQADDGTMIALNGIRLHRLDRMGNVLADFDTPVSGRPGNSSGFTGPLNPAISPDGTKVAYTYFWNTQSQDPTCMPPTCYTTINEGGTGYSWADRQTGWDDPALGKHSGWLFPTWIDNDNTMLSFPTHAMNYDVIADQISDGDSGNLVREWFSDTVGNNPAMGAGDITRDKRKLAFQTGAANSTLTVYHVPNFPTTWKDGRAADSERPTVCYRYSGAAGNRFSPPTFAPDGGHLAWSDAEGVKVVAVPGFDGGCSTDGASPNGQLLVAGGSDPDWGPADVPAERPRPEPTPGPGPSPGPGPGPSPEDTPVVPGGSLSATVTRAKLTGLKLRVVVPTAGTLSAAAKSKGRTVAKAAARVVQPGAQTITLKFTKAAKRALKRRAARLAVKVTFAPVGGSAQSTSLSAKLKR